MSHAMFSRRGLLVGAGAVAAASGLGLTAPSQAHAVGSGHGLTVVAHERITDRLRYLRFRTRSIAWNPGVNVLLPRDYDDSGKRYPVLFLLHGGNSDFRSWHMGLGIEQATADAELIVVMPDAATGWYSNPVHTITGRRNWETFHMAELLPWIDTNFRTHGDAAGRAVAGFSMGGFGALKYTAKYPELFSAVTSLSGPASLRGLGGLVTHWANATGKLDNGLAFGVYGAPWNQRRVSADNPVEHIEAYRNKRIALYCGTGVDHPLRQEPAVRTTQGDFSALLTRAGIEHTWVQHAGAHGALVRENMTAEIPEIVAHLRPAG